MTAPNIDPGEVAKFEALASRWWDPHSEFKPLHDINPLRVGYISERTALEGNKLLDVGCGGGILSEALAAKGATITGIDAGDGPISVAKLHLLESGLNIDYSQSTAESWAAEHPATYDALTCLEMLEHVPDPGSVVRACAAMVKPGGNLFFSTINRNPKAYLFAIIGAEHILRLLPKGTHDYAKFIKPAELAQWLRDAGLLLRDTTGLLYNPFSKHYTLGRDTDVNYIVHAVKPA